MVLGIVVLIFLGGGLKLLSLLLFLFAYLALRKFWKARFFNKTDIMDGKKYIKWYDTQFQNKGEK